MSLRDGNGLRQHGKHLQVSRATLALQIEQLLTEDIVRWELKPGQRLPATELAQRYGCSPTPVREALQRMVASGLVEWSGHAGARVAGVSPEDLRDLYEIRLLLETEALRRCIRLADPGYLAALSGAMATLRQTETDLSAGGLPSSAALLHASFGEADRAFHSAVFSGCRSPWLLRLISILHDHAERYRLLAADRLRSARDVVGDHEALYQAILRLDEAEAEQALREFWAVRYRVWQTLLVQHLTVDLLGDLSVDPWSGSPMDGHAR